MFPATGLDLDYLVYCKVLIFFLVAAHFWPIVISEMQTIEYRHTQIIYQLSRGEICVANLKAPLRMV